MAAGVRVRAATRKDRATLLHFHQALYVRYRDEIMDPAHGELYAYRDFEAALRDDVDGILLGAHAVALIAERDGEPVGYITGHIERDERRVLPKKGVIEDWYVEAEARSGGVGRKLLEALVQHFENAGCDVVESGTWAFNKHAREVHKLAGFVEIEVKFRKSLRGR